MGLALATGIMDATTFSDYHVFVSNQTGNTALLAVGALRIGGGVVRLKDVGISLALFVAGGFALGQVANVLGPRRRSWLIATNTFQTVLVAAATGLRWKYPTTSGSPGSLGVLALLAFASGAQIAVARQVNVPEITTAMVTSAYIDLIIDPRLTAHRNRPRNRRFFFICMLLVGSFIGAVADRFVSTALGLLLGVICKAMVTVSFMWNADVEEDAHEIKSEPSSEKTTDDLRRSADSERQSVESVRSAKSSPV